CICADTRTPGSRGGGVTTTICAKRGGLGMRRRRYAIIGMLSALAVLVGACGNPSATTSTPAKGGTLTIDNESGTLWSCGFNPFNGNVNFLAFGPIYEPLVYVNLLNGKQTPLLASSYKWSSDNKTL